MTTDQLIALYTPLAGIVGLAFYCGILTGKVAALTDRVAKLEKAADDDTGMAVQMGILTERLSGVINGQSKLDREMQGVQRTLANIASGKVGAITKFEQD